MYFKYYQYHVFFFYIPTYMDACASVCENVTLGVRVCVCVHVYVHACVCVCGTCVSLLQLLVSGPFYLLRNRSSHKCGTRAQGWWATQENREMDEPEGGRGKHTATQGQKETKSYRAAWLIPATAALILQGTQPRSAALKRLIPLMRAAMWRGKEGGGGHGYSTAWLCDW